MTQANGNVSSNGQTPKVISNDTLMLNGNAPEEEKVQKEPINLDTSKFEKNVILKQSPVWSRAMAWTIMGVATFAVAWAAIAKIEQVVPAKGQLKPKGTVKEIQAPINGVVKSVEVKDGDYVTKDQPIVIFDSEATQAELRGLQKIYQSLVDENRFYKTLIDSNLSASMVKQAIVKLKLPLEIEALALNRSSLVEENNVFAIQLGSGNNTSSLKSEQISRIAASKAESNSRAAAARLEIEQLEKQLIQNQFQLIDAQDKLENDRKVLAEIEQRNELSISKAEESLRIEQGILDSIDPLVEEGGIARIQRERQKQQVRDRQKDLIELKSKGKIEYDNQRQQAITRVAEIEQLKEEHKRISLHIDQALEQLNNTVATTEKDGRERIAENNKRIAEIDSQINKIIVENEKKMAETNSQIKAAQQTIKYQVLKAPVSGTVFDLQASPGFVPKSGQSEALMKIVPEGGPDNPLIAEVYVTNEDIGFVQKGQVTDVRIDSFPYSEFGDIKGKVYLVGSDALPPDQIHNFYRFPIKVEMDQQYLKIRDGKVELQSGMSITVNIKVKENRTVLSLFTELFTKKVDSLKNVR